MLLAVKSGVDCNTNSTECHTSSRVVNSPIAWPTSDVLLSMTMVGLLGPEPAGHDNGQPARMTTQVGYILQNSLEVPLTPTGVLSELYEKTKRGIYTKLQNL